MWKLLVAVTGAVGLLVAPPFVPAASPAEAPAPLPTAPACGGAWTEPGAACDFIYLGGTIEMGGTIDRTDPLPWMELWVTSDDGAFALCLPAGSLIRTPTHIVGGCHVPAFDAPVGTTLHCSVRVSRPSGTFACGSGVPGPGG